MIFFLSSKFQQNHVTFSKSNTTQIYLIGKFQAITL